MAQTKIKLIADGVIDENHLKVGHTITTDNIGEGTNLYYTDARIGSYLSTNSYATEGYVTTAVANLVDAAPSTLDTLNELAAALGDDPNFATTVTNSIATKLPLAGGTISGNLTVSGNLAVDTNTLYVDSANNRVGVNTTSPETEVDILGTLTIQSSAANIILKDTGASDNEDWRIVANGGPLQIQSRTNAGVNTSRVLFDNNGDVSFYEDAGSSVKLFWDASAESLGIGTTTPATKLHVESSSYDDFIKLTRTSVGSMGISATNPRGIQTTDGAGNFLGWHVDSSGNVGIGATLPDSNLHIKTSVDNVVNQGLVIERSANSDKGYINYQGGGFQFRATDGDPLVFGQVSNERMRIGSDGNVGIGTASPNNKLTVASVNGTTAVSIINSSPTTTSTFTNYLSFFGTNNGGGLFATPLAEIGGVSGNGGTVVGSMVFKTTPAFGSSTERMRIDSAGNVGIGETTSPTYKLEVSAPSGSQRIRVGTLQNAGNTSTFEAITSSTVTTASSAWMRAIYGGGVALGTSTYNKAGGDSGDFGNLSSESASERMRIDASGNVGIGTSSPSALLDVNGDALINSLTVGRGGGNVAVNVALGNTALPDNTTGSGNTAVGQGSLRSNTTANNNTAIGQSTLFSNTASNNTAVGKSALFANTSGTNNTGVGYLVLEDNTTGVSNTAIGLYALSNNTTANNNTAVGVQALYLNTTGANNVSVGVSSLIYNTTGSNNVAVGKSALQNATTAPDNTAVGGGALLSNTTGASNVALGAGALYNNTTAGNNTALGFGALVNNTTGNTNVAVGYSAGATNTTGVGNVFIGESCGGATSGDLYSIVVGRGATGKGTNTGFISPNNGAVYQGNNSSTWSTTSDERLKKNIVDNSEGLDKIKDIRVRNFEYRKPEEITELSPSDAIKKEGVQLGVIAQELQQVLPECVRQESTGAYTVNSDKLIWYMVNAIKELKAEIDILKSK